MSTNTYYVVRYRNGAFDGGMSGMGRHKGTWDSESSLRTAQRHAQQLRGENEDPGISYQVEMP